MNSPVEAEITNFKRLCEQLGDELDLTDPETFDALMEGESDLKEIAQALIDEFDAVEVLQVGLKYKVDQLKDRFDLQKKRLDRIKVLMGRIMEKSPDKTMKLDSATVTVRKGVQSVVIVNEADIPFDMMNTPPQPTPNKNAILSELKAKREVPGCTLSNGVPSLQIRRN